MRQKLTIFLTLLILLNVLALTVIPPGQAYTFTDDFETENFDKWNAVFGNAAVVTDANCYSGLWKAQFSTTGTNEDRVRLDVDAQAVIFASAWVCFDTLPSVSGHDAQFSSIGRLGSGWAMRAQIRYNGSDVVWRIGFYNSSGQYWDSSALMANPGADNWHNVTIMVNYTSQSQAQYKMWINSTELTDVAQVCTRRWATNDFYLCGAQHLDYSTNVWIDDVDVYYEEQSEPAETEGAIIGYFDDLDFENRELRFACQRKTFFAQYRHWLFYANHTAGQIQYVTSQNGINFTAPTNLLACNVTFAVWNNNTHVAIVTTHSSDSLRFRYGQLRGNGSIQWLDTWQTMGAGNYIKCTRPNVRVNQYGAPWICYNRFNTSDSSYAAYASRSDLQNGSWSDASGFPYEVDSTVNYHAWRGMFHEIAGVGMYLLYYIYDTEIRGRLWNYTTTSWESIESGAAGTDLRRLNAAVDSAGTIHIMLAPAWGGAAGYRPVYYMNRTNSGFSTPWLIGGIYNTPSFRGESIVVNGLDVYLIWRNSSNEVAQKNKTGGVWNDAFIWKETATCNIYCGMQAYYLAAFNQLGFAWVTGTTNPYTLKYQAYSVATSEAADQNPVISQYGYNTTKANSGCNFSAYISDDYGLDYGIFSSNLTGSWVNETYALIGLGQWLNITKTLPAANTRVEIIWYANDTGGNWTAETDYLVTTSENNPIYSSPGYSTTVQAAQCRFSCFWSDASGLDYGIFSYNGTGIWENFTIPLSGSAAWANITKQLPYGIDEKVGHKWYCRDTGGLWSETPIYLLRVTEDISQSTSNFLWTFLLAGDILGWVMACYTIVMGQIVYAWVTMLCTTPIYIKSRSLPLLCIVWILLGGFIIVAMPIVSGIGLFLSIFGLAALFVKLIWTRV